MKETLQIVKHFILTSSRNVEVEFKAYQRILEDIKWRDEQIQTLKEQRHRKNMLIENLKKQVKELKEDIYPATIAELILITACRSLKGNVVDNPMKGLRGYDCDSLTKAENAIRKVCCL